MKQYYIYSDFVYGEYVVERTAERIGRICGILKYPSQRAPANSDVVREIVPFGEGTVKYFDFQHSRPYGGHVADFKETQKAAIDAAISDADGDAAVLEILHRHKCTRPCQAVEQQIHRPPRRRRSEKDKKKSVESMQGQLQFKGD